MDLTLEPPRPHYKVVTLTLLGHNEPYVELGPVLAATYDRREFEVLYPFRAVTKPIEWSLHKNYGSLESPDVALWLYLKEKNGIGPDAAIALLSQDFDRLYGGDDRYMGGGAVALDIPPRQQETLELRAREVAA